MNTSTSEAGAQPPKPPRPLAVEITSDDLSRLNYALRRGGLAEPQRKLCLILLKYASLRTTRGVAGDIHVSLKVIGRAIRLFRTGGIDGVLNSDTPKEGRPSFAQEKRAAIRSEYRRDEGTTVRQLAKKHGISIGTVSNIIRRK